ncbi:hypothetical protein IFU40_06330 [Microbacterium sp. CFBP 13617]|uniref:helix-turn-helix transcriptional regulator n=1 Tax=Microbacterium sp. CFBP 13617 TaxID=2774035 RepID=UPI0017814258|nr:hypothetical protein [Microbacterium sp. CFBP 13617]MBD8218250.1 hypothetical protein [Microbacterium sp. CFBP 13617]
MSAVAPVTPIRSAKPSAEVPVWLSPAQVCEVVPVLTVRDLEDMRSNGTGPAYSRPTPRKVVYLEADVRAWVQSKRQTTREQS